MPPARSIIVAALSLAAVFTLTACSSGHDDGDSGGTPEYAIGGTVSGLQGSGLTLRTDMGDVLVVSRDGPFAFAGKVEDGSPYRVSVVVSPSYPAQQCDTTQSAGMVQGADVTGIQIACASLATPALQAEPDVYGAALSWNAVNGAARYDIVVSSAPGCTAQNHATCPEGRLIGNTASPYRVDGLHDEVKYYFRVETIYTNAARSLSADATARPNGLAFRGPVQAIALAPDGTVYLGGDFRAVDIYRGSGLPLDAVTGEPSTPDYAIVGSEEEFNVSAVIPDGSGGWYIGGQLSYVGGQARDRLAHVRADGSVDMDWKPSANGWVRALIRVGEVVYVGGEFTTIDGQPRDRLAAISATGDLLPWNPGANGAVRTLAASAGVVYIGGEFSQVAGSTRNHVAAVATDGTLRPWNPDASGIVLTLAVSQDTIYAGGTFGAIGGAARGGLAALDTSGIALPWNPVDAGGAALDIEPVGDTIYIAGFVSQGAESRSGLAAIDISGTLLAWNPAPDAHVWAITHVGSTIYAGGYFNQVSGVERHHLAAIDTNGNVLPWNPQPNGGVWALAASDDIIYAGGDFNALGPGFARDRLAALAPDGRLLPWNPQADGQVRSMALAGDTLYVGGSFRSISGEIRGSLAAIRTDGTLLNWAPRIDGALWPWQTQPGENVYTLAVGNSTIYVGGTFAYANNQPRVALAAFDLDGNLTPWNPAPLRASAPAYTSVRTLTISGNTIYIGGSMDSLGGVPRQNIAAVDPAGALLPWNPGANGSVFTIATAGGITYAGGQFSSIDGAARSHVAAFSADGALLPWNPGADDTVSLIVPSGPTVYLGGYFRNLGNEPRSFLAAVDTAGALLPWNPRPNYVPFALAVANERVYLGGVFTQIGHEPRFRYATVNATTGNLLP